MEFTSSITLSNGKFSPRHQREGLRFCLFVLLHFQRYRNIRTTKDFMRSAPWKWHTELPKTNHSFLEYANPPPPRPLPLSHSSNQTLLSHHEVELLCLLLIGPPLGDAGLAEVGLRHGGLDRLGGAAVVETLRHIVVLDGYHVLDGGQGGLGRLLYLAWGRRRGSELTSVPLLAYKRKWRGAGQEPILR